MRLFDIVTDIDALLKRVNDLEKENKEFKSDIKELKRESLHAKSEKLMAKYKKMIGKMVSVENNKGYLYEPSEGRLLDLVLSRSGIIEAHLKGKRCIEVKHHDRAIRLINI